MNATEQVCLECGKNEFTNRDGFFFCIECGTEVENIIETAIEDEFINNTTRTTTKKVQSATENILELTSWECVNYVLVGLVNELISLGANDDFKLKVFQIWAEYLRKNEVAFQNKKHFFPKLSASFNPRDAAILYNHHMPKRKRRASQSSAGASSTSNFRKLRRKFARMEYETSLSQTDYSLSTLMSSSQTLSSKTFSSVSSARAFKLNFKDSARKVMKKSVPLHHLKRHESDITKDMECKCIPIKRSLVYITNRLDEIFSRRTLFCVLYIALNLTNDEIQLTDLVRFLRNGSLSSKKFGHFFPDNVKESCEKILSRVDFPQAFDQSGISIRQQSATICKLLSIRKLNTPNMNNLVERFCKDFMLPYDFRLYITRLINFYPPEMNYKFRITPFYEGRALAYILFIFKLLFGLDDVKEVIISDSAKKVNNFIDNRSKLFVWTDWMEYIEMRKLILCRYNLCYFSLYNNSKDFKSYAETYSIDHLDIEDKILNRENVLNMNHIFELFLKASKAPQPFSSFKIITSTPQLDYFERILYDPPGDIIVCDSLKYDHSSTEINSFLNTKNLRRYLKQKNIELNVFKIKGNEQLNFVNTFSNSERRLHKNRSILQRIKFANAKTAHKLQETKNKMNAIFSKIMEPEYISLVNGQEAARPIEILENHKNDATKLKKKTKGLSKEAELKLYKLKYQALLNKSEVALEEYIFFNNSSSEDESPTVQSGENENGQISNVSSSIKLSISDMSYWIYHGNSKIKELDFRQIKGQMPKNFVWLLETFAAYLECDPLHIYHELMILENQYFYKLEDIDKIKNIISLKNPDAKDQKTQFAENFAKQW